MSDVHVMKMTHSQADGTNYLSCLCGSTAIKVGKEKVGGGGERERGRGREGG